MSKPDMAALMQQFLDAQNGTAVAAQPVKVLCDGKPVFEAATVAAPAATVSAPVTVVPATPATPDLAALMALLLKGVAPPANGKTPAKAKGGEWHSEDVELPNGEKVQLRVAPKGYGCVGFESRKDYSCIYGYKQRHEALADLFGDGYRTHVLDRLVAMGMVDRDTE